MKRYRITDTSGTHVPVKISRDPGVKNTINKYIDVYVILQTTSLLTYTLTRRLWRLLR